MKRAMFFYERFVFVGGRATWNGIVVARLRGPLQPDALQAALTGLQARHPELRVGIETRDRRPWFVTAADPPPIPLRIAPRDHDGDWLEVVGAELERPFPLPEGPLARLVCVRPSDPTSGPCELVLVCHHCICDGRSLLIVMRGLLDQLAEPSLAVVSLPEIASFSDLPLGPRPIRELVRWRDSAAVTAARLLLPATRLLVRTRRRSPAYVLTWNIDQTVLERLSVRCREQGISSYVAIATALMRAFLAERPRQTLNRLICPIDIRSLLPGIGQDRLFPFAESVTLSLDYRQEREFWQQARALGTMLDAKRKRVDPVRRIVMGERLHGVADLLFDLLLRGRVRQDLVLTYLARPDLPQGQGPSSLIGVPAILSSMPWRDGTMLAILKDGAHMPCVLVSYEELLPMAQAQRIRDHAMTLLTAALSG